MSLTVKAALLTLFIIEGYTSLVTDSSSHFPQFFKRLSYNSSEVPT